MTATDKGNERTNAAHGTEQLEGRENRTTQLRIPARVSLVRLLVGVAFVLAGVVLFVSPTVQLQVETNLFEVGWPFLVIGLGIVLLVTSFLSPERSEAIPVVGGVVFGAGIVLAVQNAAENWEAWYVWPLAAFGGAGLGRLVYGLATRRASSLRSGALLAGAGVVLAVIGAGIEGDLSTTVLAAGLVLLGLVVVLFGVRPRRRESGLQ